MQNDRSDSKSLTVERAMRRFWSHGYDGVSMRDLVEATGSHRAAIYNQFGGKAGLLAACLTAYRELIVTPAFSQVEAADADLASIASYFEQQIALAESVGLPGPGCLMANMMTERAPHDPDTLREVRAHYERLQSGFRNALTVECKRRSRSEASLNQLADFLAIGAQGLWSHSRIVESAAPLRAYVVTLMLMLEDRLK